MCDLRQLGELRDFFFSPSEQKVVAEVLREVADDFDPPRCSVKGQFSESREFLAQYCLDPATSRPRG
jgi:hypothetical protein